MKAVRMTAIGQPLALQEIPVPPVGPGEVLVQIKAAGICHSDAHYRAGTSSTGPLPQTLGHEIAGVVEAVGPQVTRVKPGDRVCLHYLVTCGQCEQCNRGHEQFCVQAQMLGKHRDGGYAEFIAVPERGVVHLPAEIPFEHAAIMMCSSSTSFHALRKTRLQPGETVAVFGAGGLGMSAIQLARGLGALTVYAVDINPDKLALAAQFGAIPVDASQVDPVAEIMRLTDGRGCRCGAGADRPAADHAPGRAVARHPGPRRAGRHHPHAVRGGLVLRGHRQGGRDRRLLRPPAPGISRC